MTVHGSEVTSQIRAATAAGICFDPRDPGDTSPWDLDAEDLAAAILDPGQVDRRPRQLWIRGARVSGEVELSGAAISVACNFEACLFENVIHLSQSSLPSLKVRGGVLPGLNGNQTHVAGDLELGGLVHVSAPIRLTGAKVDGTLSVSNAALHSDYAVALDCDRIVIGENFDLGPNTTLSSALQLDNSSIKGNLTCSAQISHPTDRSIDANLLHVDGNVTFDGGYSCEGTIRLAGANIGGRLHFDGGTVSKGSSRDYAIDAESLSVSQNVDLDGHMRIEGPVHLSFAQLGAQLCLNDVILHACDEIALDGQGAHVNADVVVSGSSDVVGRVDFTGADIKGDFACDHASFHNPADKALLAERAGIGGSMFLTGSRIWGTVGLMGAHIGGDFDCIGAQIHNAGGDAILARRATVDKDVLLCDSFVAEGTVDLVRVVVGGSLRCEDATFVAPGLKSLDLRGAKIGGVFRLLPATRPEGEVALLDAQCAVLRDDERTWPEILLLDGFAYGSIDPEAPQGVEQRLRWLARNQGGYSARSYEQLIGVLHSGGSEEEARRVALDGQRQRARLVPIFVRPLYWTWGITVGYGYSLRRLFPWIVGLLAFGTVFFWMLFPVAFKPTSTAVPAFNSLFYTLDLVVPVFKLGESSGWVASGSALYIGWILSVIGWALAAAVVAGISQIVRKG